MKVSASKSATSPSCKTLADIAEKIVEIRIVNLIMEEFQLKLYNTENYILTDVKDFFLQNGYLNTFDFFCIIIWKANRAKSKIAKRLLKFNSNLDESVIELTSKIYLAETEQQKLNVLIVDFGFRLPMASAILSLLYPEKFTIFDIRVCDTFPEYKGIENLKFEKLWIKYSQYILSVRNYGELNVSLRDKDRLLWGKSFQEQLENNIKSNFK